MLSRTDAMSCGTLASTFTLPNHDGVVRVLILRYIVSGMSNAVLMGRMISKIRGQSEAALQYGFIDLCLPCYMVVGLLIQSPGIAHLNVAFGFSISGKMDVYVSSAYGTAPRIQTTVRS